MTKAKVIGFLVMAAAVVFALTVDKVTGVSDRIASKV
jgi:hypothetical protein